MNSLKPLEAEELGFGRIIIKGVTHWLHPKLSVRLSEKDMAVLTSLVEREHTKTEQRTLIELKATKAIKEYLFQQLVNEIGYEKARAKLEGAEASLIKKTMEALNTKENI